MGIGEKLLGRKLNRRMAAFQDELLAKHVEEVEHVYQQMRGWRHDYHNHLQTIKAYRALGQEKELDGYLDLLEQDLTQVDTVLKSGNVKVDAILNSKLSLAKARDIQVTAKAVVPKSLSLSEVDLCVILGNLLDNAIEACLQLPDQEQRFIRVYLDLKGDNLYLCITNAAQVVEKRNGRYISHKGENHGFGLFRVDRLVEKHRGYLKRADEEGAFTCEVLLPLESHENRI